ncbi:hypothetical protein PEC18_31145 [Paucibacter sp. O1-1]|nr:hypothetical protein [Paucibacter sp. O1-1]MDA3830162.1 hypothetical protein [Paucibacter sp. O1-1]
MADPINELETRINKLASEVDALAVMLPRSFAKSRLQTVRTMAEEVAARSQAVVLSMRLDRPSSEVRETVAELQASLAQLRLMSSRTRIEQGTLLTLVLMEKLVGSLCADLSVWERAV